MKFIKIFLASSIVEFEKERRQLGDFVRSLNDTYVKRGIYFELIMCEDLTNSLAAEHKQQEYNQSIRESQYFYVLFGRNAGAYTVEEFDVALEQFRASGTPRIFTYFLNLPEGGEAGAECDGLYGASGQTARPLLQHLRTYGCDKAQPAP